MVMNAERHASTAIERAALLLREGGLVAFPTETVYGLGANALDLAAVARIFDVKGRPRFDPLIVHIADRSDLEPLVTEFPPAARQLADRFWPGPLTLVLPKAAIVPDLVTAGGPTVAVRIPDHPLALALLRAAGLPVAAPSANPFGRVSPTTAEHVREQLGDRIDLILDGGPCRVGIESTVLQLTDGRARLLRPGGVTLEEIEAVIGRVTVPDPAEFSRRATLLPGARPMDEGMVAGLASPGLLPQHYAPRTRLVLVDDSETHEVSEVGTGRRVGLLSARPFSGTGLYQAVEVLSQTGDLCESAANFFAALRRLDAAGLDLIIAQTFPEQGLGRALNDRLRRAASKC